LFVIRVVLLLIVMFYVLFMCKCVLPPGVNPIAVDKYINISLFYNVLINYLEIKKSLFEISLNIHKKPLHLTLVLGISCKV
jgi:hypothetical protein